MLKDDRILYHYTTVDSAHAILKSKSIWMTDYRFLNDKNEFNSSLDLFLSLVPSDIKKTLQHAIFHHMLKHVYTVFSLSKSVEVLSQWRSYADDGYGIALGFSQNFFNGFVARRNTQYELIECIYDEHEQHIGQLIQNNEDNIQRIIDAATKTNVEPDRMRNIESVSSIIHEVVVQLFAIKNRAFTEEQEVRFVSYAVTNEAKTRATNRLIIPYIEIPLHPTGDEACFEVVLNNIYLGPKCDERNKEGILVLTDLTHCRDVHRYDCGYQ